MAQHKILIVDDDPSMRMIVRTALEDDGFILIEAEDVDSGWRAVQEAEPELVLCDYEMQGADGFELVRRIRANELHAGIPVIMLTAHRQVSRALKGVSVGTSDYVVKPFDPEDLRKRILFHLNQGHTRGPVVFPDAGDD